MLSLCQPYSPAITCLCDQDTTVLRCFITGEEGDGEDHVQEDMVMTATKEWHTVPEQECARLGDMKTELIIAGAILVIIIGLLCL